MNKNDSMVRFMYSTLPGRIMLKFIQTLRFDRVIVAFLRSPLSKPYMIRYARRHEIPLTREQANQFRTYRNFFLRQRDDLQIDPDPDHFISPCDSLLSAYTIDENSSFSIKGSRYRVCDLLEDESLAKKYEGGICLIFRLCASDYHHYCYIDNGYQGEHHFIPGVLHSVQPIACETVPVFTLNRRSWCLLETEHFGPVVQTEIGALVVGGIVNAKENCSFVRGEEKGHFDLSGSTISLLLEPGRICLRPELLSVLNSGEESRVTLGQWIAYAKID